MIKQTFFGDFETYAMESQYYQEHQDTNVYLWGLKSQDGKIQHHGFDIESFFKTFKKIYVENGVNNFVVYFHNLDFDGVFIYKALENGKWGKLKYKTAFEEKQGSNWFDMFRHDRSIYHIKVRKSFKHQGKTKHINISFECSYKKITLGVEALSKNKHNYEDYNRLVELGWTKDNSKESFYNAGCKEIKDNQEVLKIYLDYLWRDIDTVIEAFNQLDMQLGENSIFSKSNGQVRYSLKDKLTMSSTSFSQQINSVGILSRSKNIREKEKQRYEYIMENMFVDSYDSWELANMFYMGGFTQFNKEKQAQDIEVGEGRIGICIDINSSYPYQMTKLLPFGNLSRSKDPNWDGKYLEYVEVVGDFKIREKYKNLVCLPRPKYKWFKYQKEGNIHEILSQWNQLKKEFKVGQRYVKEIKNAKYYFLKQEFEIISQIYEVKVQKMTSYFSKAYNYLSWFSKYNYNKRLEYKKNKDIKERPIKILLNSAYGGWGMKAFYNTYEFLEQDLNRGDIVKLGDHEYKVITKCTKLMGNKRLYGLDMVEKDKKKFRNVLVAATITAYGRIQLLNAILKIGVENFIYCDTDSIYGIVDYDGEGEVEESAIIDSLNAKFGEVIDIDMSKLGSWKVEGLFDTFFMLGAKKYQYKFRGSKWKIKAAGVKEGMIDNLEKILENGVIIEGKYGTKETENGVVLVPSDIEIKQGEI